MMLWMLASCHLVKCHPCKCIITTKQAIELIGSQRAGTDYGATSEPSCS